MPTPEKRPGVTAEPASEAREADDQAAEGRTSDQIGAASAKTQAEGDR